MLFLWDMSFFAIKNRKGHKKKRLQFGLHVRKQGGLIVLICNCFKKVAHGAGE
jgi:hypothetical protein